MARSRACLAAWMLLVPRPSLAAPGSTAANFLEIGAPPRPAALGQAFSGVADDVNAAVYNPAGLATLQRQELTLVHNQYVAGVQQEYLAYALPTEKVGTFGLTANVLRVLPFAAYDADDRRQADVTAQDAALGLAYAYGPGPVSLGVSGSLMRSRLDDARAEGTSWDAGLLWRAGDRVRVGLAARHLGPKMRFLSDSFPLPATGKAGASLRLPAPWEGARLLAAAEGSFPRHRPPYASGGLEFEPVDFAALRVGYQGSLDSGVGVSAGFGLKLIHRAFSYFSYSEYPEWFPGVEIDYAFLALDGLGSAHRLGVTVKFGRTKGGERAPDRLRYASETESYGIYGMR